MGEAAGQLRALLTDDVVTYYLSLVRAEPFKKVVALPAIAARSKAMADLAAVADAY